jgi:hypothetical protein
VQKSEFNYSLKTTLQRIDTVEETGMYVYICIICTYIYEHIHLYAHAYTYICKYIYILKNIYIYVHVYIYRVFKWEGLSTSHFSKSFTMEGCFNGQVFIYLNTCVYLHICIHINRKANNHFILDKYINIYDYINIHK